jgi:hypothetical protein
MVDVKVAVNMADVQVSVVDVLELVVDVMVDAMVDVNQITVITPVQKAVELLVVQHPVILPVMDVKVPVKEVVVIIVQEIVHYHHVQEDVMDPVLAHAILQDAQVDVVQLVQQDAMEHVILHVLVDAIVNVLDNQQRHQLKEINYKGQ